MKNIKMNKINKVIILTVLFSLFSVLFSSCVNPFIPPEDFKGKEDGIGYLSVAIGAVNPRTIMPKFDDYDPDDLLYSLTVSTGNKENGEVVKNKVSIDDLFDMIPLSAGTWNIYIDAYAETAEDDFILVAEGSEIGIVINSGDVNVQSITLVISDELKMTLLAEGGTGTFIWDVDYVGEDRSTVRINMIITPISDNGETVRTITVLQSGSLNATKSLQLEAGFYRVLFELSGSGKKTWRDEILHIYPNMESEFEYTFTTEHLNFGGNTILVTNGNDSGAGSLRQAIVDVADGGTIVVDANVRKIGLLGRLSVTKGMIIEGNSVVITRSPSWTAVPTTLSQLLTVTSVVSGSNMVTIRRVHFKDGRATNNGSAIDNRGNLTLESSIFSGNLTISNNAIGGAILNGGQLIIIGCTFFKNGFTGEASFTGYGGAIYNMGAASSLSLSGNLFIRNFAGVQSRGHIVFRNGGTISSNGYNIVDVELGGANNQSGFDNNNGTDKYFNSTYSQPISSTSFNLITGTDIIGLIQEDFFDNYPNIDFYGKPIIAPATAGAVQAILSGYYFEVMVNNDTRGKLNILTVQDFEIENVIPFNSNVSITIEQLIPSYEFGHWLVNGQNIGSEKSINITVTENTLVQAFFYKYNVINFSDDANAATTPGTLRYGLINMMNNDIINFYNVTPGESVLELTSNLPEINRSITVEGNGIVITRSSSRAINQASQLLRIGNDVPVKINRIHFKNGRVTTGGAAISNNGILTLESCIFSGNKTDTSVGNGGAISNTKTMYINGCTFFGNAAGNEIPRGNGGAIVNSGQLFLMGNIFYQNTAASRPVIFHSGGIITSHGYNVFDVALSTTNSWSGSSIDGDISIGSSVLPISPSSFRIIDDNAIRIIPNLPTDYPVYDFYGSPIIANAAAGAVQNVVSGIGFNLDVTIKNNDRGSIDISPEINIDGMISGTVTINAYPTSLNDVFWLIDGRSVDSGNELTLNINKHTKVQVIFARIFNIYDFSDSNTPGTLRHAINNILDDDIIRFVNVTPGVSVVTLSDALPQIDKNIIVEGNGITITPSLLWSSNEMSQLLRIGAGAEVSINRMHFKDGMATANGGAIFNAGYLFIESSIFSGNKNINFNSTLNVPGGAIYNANFLSIKGCTFYRNEARGGTGGAIYNISYLSLSGNIFYGNIGGISHPIINNTSLASTSEGGFNVVDVALGVGNNQSGFNGGLGSRSIGTGLPPPISPTSFKLLYESGAEGVITNIPVNYPAFDFYGEPIIASAAAGAVQGFANGSGFYLDASVNDKNKGSLSVLPAPCSDGLISGNVTITPQLKEHYEVRYWLVNGINQGTGNVLSLTITEHTIVQAILTRKFIVDNFSDSVNAATTPGTLRYALTNILNDDMIIFTGVEPGVNIIELTSLLPVIIRDIEIEGNGITITRALSWSPSNRFINIGRFAVVKINRVHFKDGRAGSGTAIYNEGNLTLMSCIFSGNQGSSGGDAGGAIYNRNIINIYGCTFYENSTNGSGGAIMTFNTNSIVNLNGNILYRNTSNVNGNHNVHLSSGSVLTLGYNVSDVMLVTRSAGTYTPSSDDIVMAGELLNPETFAPANVGALHTLIPTRPANFPLTDFYGNLRVFPGPPGAVVEAVTTCAHDSGEWVTTLEPTCTITGTRALQCSICDYSFETETISAFGHDVKWIITTHPVFPSTPGEEKRSCTQCDYSENETRDYPILEIGDTGPGGGIIFYVADGDEGRPTSFAVQGYGNRGDEGYFASYIAYYLEAAPADMATTLMWASNSDDLIPDLSQNVSDQTDWTIGRGRMNTAIIIARGKNHTTPYLTPAASDCAALTTGGQIDWFLPSRNEIFELYRQRSLFSFTIGWFWSSSQYTFNWAWGQNIDHGGQGAYLKSRTTQVRAIRAF